MDAPTKAHMETAYQMLKYLKGCPGKGLLYQKHGNHRVVAFTDVDWAGTISDTQLTSGYCTFVGDNLITWQSKKQAVVVRSSAESEFWTMENGVYE